MNTIHEYCTDFSSVFGVEAGATFYGDFLLQLSTHLTHLIQELDSEYIVNEGVAIHTTATIDPTAIIKAPAIICKGAYIGSYVLLRNGVYVGEKSRVGAGCEVKSSALLTYSALAHFNFVGDSLIGSKVNVEAGAVFANHWNERDDKRIFVHFPDYTHLSTTEKLGALIGDRSRIGANAVLSPGTALLPSTIVPRLGLI